MTERTMVIARQAYVDRTAMDAVAERRARAVRVARRHTYLVRVLRFALPTTVIVTTVVFAFSLISQFTSDYGPVEFDAPRITDGALVMENPRLSGIDRNERAYTLEAIEASQKIGQTESIDLKGIDATMAVDPQTEVRIQSGAGTFNQTAETLKLYEGVDVVTSTGYRVELADADVDLNGGEVATDTPVQIDMLNGTLNAAGLHIVNRGEIITFRGRVKMLMQLHGRGDN